MSAAGTTITLAMIQGRMITIPARNVFGVKACGNGSMVEFTERPEDGDPWQTAAHVRETPEEIKPMIRKALGTDRKLRDWKK